MADVIYSGRSSPIASDYEAQRQSSALWEALKQQQIQSEILETQAREAEDQRKMKELVMDKLRGYGAPEQRSAELYQPLPQGAVSQALQQGQTFSNIAPGGQYYTTTGTGGGTPVQHRLGQMADIPKQTVLSGPERKMIGLPEQSPEDKQMQEVAKMILQDQLTTKRGMTLAGEKERLRRERPEKPKTPKELSFDEEILKQIASGMPMNPAQEEAWKMKHPTERASVQLALGVLKTDMDYMMAEPEEKYAMLKRMVDIIEKKGEVNEDQQAEEIPTNLPSPKEYYKVYKDKALVSKTTGRKFRTDGKTWTQSR